MKSLWDLSGVWYVRKCDAATSWLLENEIADEYGA